jgi:hypothetical protein
MSIDTLSPKRSACQRPPACRVKLHFRIAPLTQRFAFYRCRLVRSEPSICSDFDDLSRFGGEYVRVEKIKM